eukprot:227033-Pleurochrysis_carterae.AAC.1
MMGKNAKMASHHKMLCPSEQLTVRHKPPRFVYHRLRSLKLIHSHVSWYMFRESQLEHSPCRQI